MSKLLDIVQETKSSYIGEAFWAAHKFVEATSVDSYQFARFTEGTTTKMFQIQSSESSTAEKKKFLLLTISKVFLEYFYDINRKKTSCSNN